MPDKNSIINGLNEIMHYNGDQMFYNDVFIRGIADETITLLQEQEAKQPVHVHEEFKEHDWYRNEDGKIDEFAFDAGYHNGPTCKRCYYSFCIHCDPNGWNKKPCVIDEYKCPRCEKYISYGTKFCSDCGQEMKWNDD